MLAGRNQRRASNVVEMLQKIPFGRLALLRWDLGLRGT